MKGCPVMMTRLVIATVLSIRKNTLKAFPYLLLAKLHGMKEAKFYTVEEKKKDFKLQF